MIPPEPEPDPPEPEPVTDMTINVTNAMNQTLYFGIEWRVGSATPIHSEVVSIAYNQSHQFVIPSQGQTTVNVWEDASEGDVFVYGDGTIINWRAGDYTGTTPPFVEGQEVNATYAGNNASTIWDVVE